MEQCIVPRNVHCRRRRCRRGAENMKIGKSLRRPNKYQPSAKTDLLYDHL